MTSADADTRQQMKSYWQGYGEPSVEMMMLDEKAIEIVERETDEILDMLPGVRGLDVIELGAGIGRFTQRLAPLARSLHASDFMEAFVDKNREDNGHHSNLSLEVADATQMTLPADCADLVFTNWLFMYLDDSEVRAVFASILGWLRPGGHFFFRESCFHRSGSVARNHNPTKYRSPQRYFELLLEAAHSGHRFAPVFARPSRTYVLIKRNRNQICWLVRKAPLASPDELDALRESQTLLSETGVARLEAAFGPGFLAAVAGCGNVDDVCEQLDVRPGEAVLDVGCGLGELACQLAQKYGAHVIGVDNVAPLVSLALQQANQQGVQNVLFEVADIESYEMYEWGSFDLIYCRGVIRSASDPEMLLAKFRKWLKPGGRLALVDCSSGDARAPPPPSCGGCLLASLGCHGRRALATARGGDVAQKPASSGGHQLAGFAAITTADATPGREEAARANCRTLAEGRGLFVQHFGESRFQRAQANWQRRLAMCQNGEVTWTLRQVVKRED